ncbi:MAG: hypothetical protein K8S97_08200 [Anaerolineae bacterium]|nr:hypothetical protein [Anaerolineae bacterium]
MRHYWWDAVQTLLVACIMLSLMCTAPQQAVTDADLDITLAQLTITPSQTSLELCWDLPDSGLTQLPTPEPQS